MKIIRLETGVVRGADDWPGVFIRGDHAIAYEYAISRAVEMLENAPSADTASVVNALVELQGLLSECNINGNNHDPGAVQEVVRVS